MESHMTTILSSKHKRNPFQQILKQAEIRNSDEQPSLQHQGGI
jgi:hypothetical protein